MKAPFVKAEVRLSFVGRTSLGEDVPQREVRLSEKPDFGSLLKGSVLS